MGGFIKIRRLDRELCSIEGCQSYICVSLTVDAKVSLAQRELLVEVPSLRVMLLSQNNCEAVLGGAIRVSEANLVILGSSTASSGHF